MEITPTGLINAFLASFASFFSAGGGVSTIFVTVQDQSSSNPSFMLTTLRNDVTDPEPTETRSFAVYPNFRAISMLEALHGKSTLVVKSLFP